MISAERPTWCAARSESSRNARTHLSRRHPGYTQECEKYGAVKQCVIFEVTERSVAPEEAVRTFVAFEKQVPVRTPCTCALFCNATLAPSTQESALKAFLDLEGRFFAGRKISCAFYDETRFVDRQLDEAQ